MQKIEVDFDLIKAYLKTHPYCKKGDLAKALGYANNQSFTNALDRSVDIVFTEKKELLVLREDWTEEGEILASKRQRKVV